MWPAGLRHEVTAWLKSAADRPDPAAMLLLRLAAEDTVSEAERRMRPGSLGRHRIRPEWGTEETTRPTLQRLGCHARPQDDGS